MGWNAKVRKKKANSFGSIKNKKDLFFYIAMLIFPLTQLLLFYFVVNGNSILLAFKAYDGEKNIFFWTTQTFKDAFNILSSETIMIRRFVNSLIMYGINLALILPFALLFSLYIYVKKPANKFFRLMLFLPSIISPIIMTMLFSYFVDRAFPELMLKVFNINAIGLLSDLKSQFKTILFYNVLISFGMQILMFSNAMSGINQSIIESADVEGASLLQKFWYIVLPSIWPTLTVFIVVGVAGIFTNQLNLVGFFGSSANVNIQSLGYYLYAETLHATNLPGGIAKYPLLAAFGIIFSLIAIPLTLLVKVLLEKFGPTEN